MQVYRKSCSAEYYYRFRYAALWTQAREQRIALHKRRRGVRPQDPSAWVTGNDVLHNVLLSLALLTFSEID